MSNNPALTARCDYAMFLILGESHEDHRVRALAATKACGYDSYPEERVPAYFLDEPELLEAFLAGLAAAKKDRAPRSREELAAIIKQKEESANQGCGLFYELFEQNFTYSINRWLTQLRLGEREIVDELLKTTVYNPNPGGCWEYDAEENDIHFVAD